MDQIGVLQLARQTIFIRFMILGMFLKGLLIGFAIAMPVGPIGMLCIKHSITRGMTFGLVAGLGAAVADALYGALAGFSINAISAFLSNNQIWLQLIGALFLAYLGIANFLAKPTAVQGQVEKAGHLRVFLATFLLTLTNPMTIFCFSCIYAGLGVGMMKEEIISALIMLIGVFLGSAAWWLFLSAGTSFMGKKLNLASSGWINIISGSILLVFSAIAFLSIFK